MPDKLRPTLLIFLGSFFYSQYLAVAELINAYGNKHTDVFKLSGPGALQPDPIQENVSKLAFNWGIEPFFNPSINLFVQAADRRGSHPVAPQGFGTIPPLA